MTAKVKSASVSHEGASVDTFVEVEIDKGIGIHLVGMRDSDVKESLLRVVTALQALGYHIPGKNVVINVKPSQVRMVTSSCLDLPIAVGILVASGQLKLDERYLLDRLYFFGELGLDGSIRDYGHSGHAVVSAAARLYMEGVFRPRLITAERTAMQAACNPNVWSYAFENLADVVRFLEGEIDGVKQLVWNTDTYRRLVKEGEENVLIAKTAGSHK